MRVVFKVLIQCEQLAILRHDVYFGEAEFITVKLVNKLEEMLLVCVSILAVEKLFKILVLVIECVGGGGELGLKQAESALACQIRMYSLVVEGESHHCYIVQVFELSEPVELELPHAEAGGALHQQNPQVLVTLRVGAVVVHNDGHTRVYVHVVDVGFGRGLVVVGLAHRIVLSDVHVLHVDAVVVDRVGVDRVKLVLALYLIQLGHGAVHVHVAAHAVVETFYFGNLACVQVVVVLVARQFSTASGTLGRILIQ